MRPRLTALYSIFVMSGFCGLIYESIWAKYLRIFLGHAAYAQSVVLVVFIGGLAVGAWLIGKRSERIGQSLMVYGAVELAIGLFGIVFHGVFTTAIAWGYDKLLPATCGTEGLCVSAFVLAAGLILPQSILLGTTFPLMASGVLREFREAPGSKIAFLYFANSIGAVAGVLASTFVLVPWIGLPGTVTFAGTLNIAIAAAVYALARKPRAAQAGSASLAPQGTSVARTDPAGPAPGARGTEAPGAAPIGAVSSLQAPQASWLLWVAMLTGLSSFIYEIVWIRLLSLVLGSSFHAFELMLASFILGIAIGGLWIHRRIDRLADPRRFLAQVQIAMGLLALLSLPYYNLSFDAMAWVFKTVTHDDNGYVLFNVWSAVLAMGMMLPATIAAGMTLPLVTYVLLQSKLAERSIGIVYSVNTLGSIVGVIVAVHVGLVMLGARGALIGAASIDILLGVWIFYRARGAAFGVTGSGTGFSPLANPAGPWVAAGAIGLLTAITIFQIDPLKSASGIYRLGRPLESGAVVRYHQDGKSATVDVVRHPSGVISIRTNGKPDSSIQMEGAGPPTLDEYTAVLSGTLPFIYRANIKRAAVIGFGSGMTTATLLGSPGIERVDTIEIESAMVEGARRFLPRVERAFADPRSRIVFDDAKAYFARSRDTYDAIVSEPSNPWVSGVASLFTVEFYERIKRQLKPGGVLVQWLQCYEFDLSLLADIVTALDTSFSDYAIYATNGELLLVATPSGTLGQPVGRPFQMEPLASDLRNLGIARMDDVSALWGGSRATVDAFIQSVAVGKNSDYFPIVELEAPARRFTGARVMEFESLALAPVPLLKMLDKHAPPVEEGVSRPASPEMNLLVEYYHGEQALRFLESITQENARPTPPSYPREIHSFRAALIDCATPARTSDLWDDVILAAGMVNPVLPSARLDAFWKRMEGSSCLNGLPDSYRTWIALFHDVGNRDAVAMTQHAEMLLKRPVTTTQLEYLLLAEATGLLSQGKSAEARRWLGGDVPSSTKQLPWYRLAYVLANGT